MLFVKMPAIAIFLLFMLIQSGCLQTSVPEYAPPPDTLLGTESTAVDLCHDDTGPGMPAEYLQARFIGGDSCFENFVRRYFRMPPGFRPHQGRPDQELDMAVGVQLFFDAKGKLIKHKVFQHIPDCKECTVIAEEIILKMPDWQPGGRVDGEGKIIGESRHTIINIYFDGRHYLEELPCGGRKTHR